MRWGLVVVRGRSMTPTLLDGDVLLVRWGAAARVGALGVVRLPGERPVAVKRLGARDSDGWWLERDNPVAGADSWQLGAVGDDAVLGLVRARLWPRPGRPR